MNNDLMLHLQAESRISEAVSWENKESKLDSELPGWRQQRTTKRVNRTWDSGEKEKF